MILEETYTLSNGVEIPKLGLGTWLIENDDVVQAVKDAIAIGYRHVDTAQAYANEEGVGQAADRYFEGNRKAWRALEDAYQAGKLRAIGVSNFERQDLDNLLSACTVKPMVNQILAPISNTPLGLIRYAQEQGILVEAYSPIAHGELLKKEQVREIADTARSPTPTT